MEKCASCGEAAIGVSVICPVCGGNRINLTVPPEYYNGNIIDENNADGQRRCGKCAFFHRENGLSADFYCARIIEGHLCRADTFKTVSPSWSCRFFEMR